MKRGQATEVCQSHKGNDHAPFGRLGKHGTRKRIIRKIKVGNPPARPPSTGAYLFTNPNGLNDCAGSGLHRG